MKKRTTPFSVCKYCMGDTKVHKARADRGFEVRGGANEFEKVGWCGGTIKYDYYIVCIFQIRNISNASFYNNIVHLKPPPPPPPPTPHNIGIKNCIKSARENCPVCGNFPLYHSFSKSWWGPFHYPIKCTYYRQMSHKAKLIFARKFDNHLNNSVTKGRVKFQGDLFQSLAINICPWQLQ